MTSPVVPAPRRDLHDTVRAVLDDGSLLPMAVQPLIDLAGGTVAGWEVLSRPDPSVGLGPRELFDAAEAEGLGAELHVVALRAALALRASAPHETFLSVNVDPLALQQRVVRQELERHGDLRGVVVEVTEKSWPADDAELLRALREVRDQGAMVAMDDVGAGYSGLAQLLRVRPQLVKLDRALVSGLGTDPAARAVLRAVGDLAASMDAWVLVEGVEDADQLAAAVREGVPLAQGYHLGRPAPPWPVVDLEPLRRLTTRLALDEAVVSIMQPPERFSVVLDDAARPVQVASALPDGSTWFHPAMSMAPSTSVREALRRALTRVPADRWCPVLVTSREGTLLGGVPVDQLVHAAQRDRL